MTFRQMEIFIAVCEHKSISKTSEIFYISQQGISKTIRELEEELSCKLLVRSKNGVSPTEYGSYFLNECSSFIDRKNYLTSHILEMSESYCETINLGMAFGAIAVISYRLLSEFEQKHPHIKIEYSDHTDMQLERMLLNDEYNFCVTTGIFDSDSLSYEKVFSEGVYLYIPKTHELYRKEIITMSDLEFCGFAMFTTQFHIRHNFEIACKNAGFIPKVEISSNDFNSLKETAKENNLLFLGPYHTKNLDDVGCRYCPFPDENLKWEIFFTRKRTKKLSENTEIFYQHLRSFISSK